MKYIAVFCSAQDVDEKYVVAAREFSSLIAENNYNLVWGGSDTGLMKVVADVVQDGGGKLYGVSYTAFQDDTRKNADEMIIAKTLEERKLKMLENADAIVTLVGGTGTLDEVTEVIELRKAGEHDKPIVILNTDNFYEGLMSQFGKMEKDGFLHSHHKRLKIEDFVNFSNTPQEAIDHINKELK